MAGDARVRSRRCARSSAARASRPSVSRGRCTRRSFSIATGDGDSTGAALVRRPDDGGVRARSRRASAERSDCATSRRIRRSRGSRFRRCSGCGSTSPTRSRVSPRCCSPKDYIRYRLTGELATEPSDASATLMYDTAHLRWSEEIMRAVELPMSLLPDVGRSAEVLGRVSARRRVAHRARRGDAGRRRRRRQRVRRGGRRRRRAGRGRGELGDVGHGARADGANRSSILDCAPTRSVTSLPRRLVSDGRRAHGGRRVRVVSRAARARARRRERCGGAARRRSRDRPARRRGRDVPAVSPGRAHAAPRRGGARRVPRTQPRAHARASRRAPCSRGSASRCAIRCHDSAGARASRRASCC